MFVFEHFFTQEPTEAGLSRKVSISAFQAFSLMGEEMTATPRPCALREDGEPSELMRKTKETLFVA